MRRGILYLGLALLFAAGTFDSGAFYYVDIPFTGHEQLKSLRQQGVDIGGIDYEKKILTLVMTDEEMHYSKLGKVLNTRRIAFAPDSQYKRPEDVQRILEETENQYPHLARVEVIGKSNEGRDIHAIQLTSRFFIPPSGKKQTILIDAMHHAREVMTPEVALDIVKYLTENFNQDPKVQKWLTENEVWVVPMVNPDGNAKVWNSSSMWRKNTRGGYGVDVNRNYPQDWNTCNGSSGNQNNETYRGPSAGSEPETRALMDLAARIKPKFNISYHSFSEIVIFPYGCSPKRVPSPDRQMYEQIGRELAGLLQRDSGQGTYTAGTSYDLLYNVDGGSLDWMYAQHKIISFVIEVNSNSQGFQPSFQWQESTVKRQRKGWQYILDKMDGPALPSLGG
ncbi:MAG: zinc carboxypeptidase [Bdellovibrionaceae bacterium]|nr:zinc carboxypeptidase [Pseudobdellovibrionaceae bacterium]